MNNLLFSLAALSLGGGAAVVLLALAARVSREKYAARWRCWVWLILCVRLAIPVTFAPQSRPQPIKIQVPSDVVIFSPVPAESTPPTPVQPTVPEPTQPSGQEPDRPTPKPEAPRREVTLYEAIRVLWLIGAAGVLAWSVLCHLRFLRYVKRWRRPAAGSAVGIYNQLGDRLKLDARPKLWMCEGLKAPMLAGIFKQSLLLPPEMLEQEDLRYVLLHELTHFKRRDIWLKTLVLWVNALHWFNPLMWYMTKLVERDTELACDEAVLRRLPHEEHSAYGRTILEAVERMKA